MLTYFELPPPSCQHMSHFYTHSLPYFVSIIYGQPVIHWFFSTILKNSSTDPTSSRNNVTVICSCFSELIHSAIGYSFFQGLVKPNTSTFELRDFKVNFNWEQVSTMIAQKKVVVPYGSRHPSGMSVFYVEPHLSYFNMWGRLGLDVGR